MITDFSVFIASVVLISMSGVLLPGPLFAVTIEKATKWKTAGALIALGHGVIEFPLMFLIYFVLSQLVVPDSVQTAIGLIGGTFMIYMGIDAFRKRNQNETVGKGTSRESFFAGIWTSAVNVGFIIWWLTVGTELILNAEYFGIFGFAAFAGIHWLCDFAWYTAFALAVYTSRRFWTKRVHQAVALFCAAVFLGFGTYFLGSALLAAIGYIR